MPDGRITRRPLITVAFLGLTGCFGGSTAVVFAPRVRLDEPANGATVTSPVRVVSGVQSYAVRPSGDMPPETGHHHLIIDRTNRCRPPDPDDNHLHFGGGEVVASVPLSPGKHSLTQVADGRHVAYGGLLTATIQVEVVTIG